jgi:hypothetical protein
MMSKLKLLILDENEVIHLHEFGIWGKFINLCEVHIAMAVVDIDVSFYDGGGEEHPIDLDDDVAYNRVQVFDVSLADINRFRDRFDGIFAIDLTQVNEALTMRGADRVHAILGADVLSDRQAVFDFATLAPFVREVSA